MRTALQAPAAFQGALVEWFAAEGRDHPWRRTTDPYAVLVSELMLQQTTIAMVRERRYFERWMDAFPDVQTLASAGEESLLKLWEGLGYYNRARNLQKAARIIVAEHGGVFPRRLEDILALPGVGRYTAGAVASFAYDDPAPLVDGNVARVFARLFDFDAEIDSPAAIRQLWSWAEALLPQRDARRYNSALMELGQRVCTTGRPACLLCPVKAHCTTTRAEELPRKKPKAGPVLVTEDVLLARQNGRLLLSATTGTRRLGMWQLPPLHGRPAGREVWRGKYAITKHRVTLTLFEPAQTVVLQDGERWFTLAEIEALPMPSPFRRALEAALSPTPEAG